MTLIRLSAEFAENSLSLNGKDMGAVADNARIMRMLSLVRSHASAIQCRAEEEGQLVEISRE